MTQGIVRAFIGTGPEVSETLDRWRSQSAVATTGHPASIPVVNLTADPNDLNMAALNVGADSTTPVATAPSLSTSQAVVSHVSTATTPLSQPTQALASMLVDAVTIDPIDHDPARPLGSATSTWPTSGRDVPAPSTPPSQPIHGDDDMNVDVNDDPLCAEPDKVSPQAGDKRPPPSSSPLSSPTLCPALPKKATASIRRPQAPAVDVDEEDDVAMPKTIKGTRPRPPTSRSNPTRAGRSERK
jgi:hypothetical protein